MQLTLKVWRQQSADSPGKFETYEASGVSPDMSFLEMLDEVNEGLIAKGIEPIAFDHDCREGICGMCSAMINGVPHGPDRGTTTCQLHMRSFRDGDTIVIEPWRASALPVIRDLVVDRTAFDRIVQAGGFVSVNTGAAPDANLTPIPKAVADTAFDAATCIGCAACVAACKNASAALFTAAKIAHLRRIPQGRPEQLSRARSMVDQMDAEGFGSCTNTSDCEAACPKGISVDFISEMNADYFRAALKGA
ncbi:MAG: succinate dehydrogenase/fumarate reductase iron-sulfur subunit [Bryobacterales bacterium]|nr:succinate dehydrogenase/fumarate reductase iron-sulfur subunit [Bryobacterales bacterium]